DLARFGGCRNCIHHFGDLLARDGNFDLDLRQKVHRVFGPAVNFGMALLTSVSFDLSDGKAVYASRSQSVADLVELERLDDCHDNFHGFDPPYARSQLIGPNYERHSSLSSRAPRHEGIKARARSGSTGLMVC